MGRRCMPDPRRVALRSKFAALPSTGDHITLWATTTGCYLRLSHNDYRLLCRVAAADGATLVDLGLNHAEFASLERLASDGLVAIWDPRRGIPIPRGMIVELVAANVLAQILLRAAARPLLQRIVHLTDDATGELAIWRGWTGEQVVAAARIAGALPGVSASCLPTAIAIWLILRRRGHPAALRLGAIEAPFTAHAWAELDGCRLDPAPVVFPGPAFIASAPRTAAD